MSKDIGMLRAVGMTIYRAFLVLFLIHNLLSGFGNLMDSEIHFAARYLIMFLICITLFIQSFRKKFWDKFWNYFEEDDVVIRK